MTKAKTLMAGLILILAGLAVAAWLMFGQSAGISYANADKYTAGSTEITSEVTELDVEWTEGSVNIEYNDGDRIIISETSSRELSEDDKLRWWLDGSALRIRYAKSGIRISFVSLNKALTVSLPKGTALQAAGIHGTSAELNLGGLAAEQITLETTSGDIKGTAEAKQLKIGSTSGDIRFGQEKDMETLTLDSTSGNAGLTLGNVRELSGRTTSGGISVTMGGETETVKIHSTSGGVSLEAAEVRKADLSSTSGGVTFRAAAVDELKIGCTSGNVTAYLPENPGFTCEISTTSGDVNSELALKANGKVYTCGDGSGKYRIETTSGDVRLAK